MVSKELKTLKDLEKIPLGTPNLYNDLESKELRAEAIRWIKALEDNAKKLLEKEDVFNAKGNAMSANMFKEFFNIAPENLK